MNSFLYLNYPSWIHPEIIPGVSFLRWYGLMYVFAFGFAYFILTKLLKEGFLDLPKQKATEDEVVSFIATGIIFLLIGARIFACLVYNPDGKYLKAPWLIFWPFDRFGKGMKFTGLAGMSYHGGFIGGFLGIILWCKTHKKPVMQWMDAIAIAIPCGYTFGRLGNFLNGELYGRITTMPWGMVFPQAERFDASIPWVKEFAQKIGMKIPTSGIINLPRHPSQLYEAFFEGIFLFVIMWCLRKKKPFQGFFSAFYIAGYGVVRFIIEYFRMPDEDMGFKLGNKSADIYTNVSLLNISTGQILCFGMILLGLAIGIICYNKSKKQNKFDTTKKRKNKN